jgi:outer membrane protein OmpA-like peptidoglycan-associated protein
MRVRGLTMVLLLTTATAASAQSAGTFELTGFGRFTRFDDTLRIQEEFGGGGSLGFFLLPFLALEAEAAYTSTHSNVTGLTVSNAPLRGRLSLHIPIGGYASGIRIGAGYVRNLYRKSASFNDDGFTGIAGVRWGLSPNFGFRIDGTADYVRSPDGGRADNYINWGAQVGLSLMLDASPGGTGVKETEVKETEVKETGIKDKDQDGVGDKLDQCPGTPVGKAVDGAGCAASQKDGDRDNVNDEADRCPGTPAGELVDAEGCSSAQRDDDRDGIPNPADRCPGTPAGQAVDSTGCVPVPPDEDKDGVPDSADQCPASPAGAPVNPHGCPVRRDSDADGVHDGLDLCPNTPKGEAVNENGCTILFQKQARTVILRGVNFQTGKATLTPEARDVLRDIASQLVENPQYRVQISGHTDNTGSRAANLRLSIARARTVETFLEANGVPRTQVTSKGFGPSVPIAPNATAAGRAQNRRVELHRTN